MHTLSSFLSRSFLLSPSLFLSLCYLSRLRVHDKRKAKPVSVVLSYLWGFWHSAAFLRPKPRLWSCSRGLHCERLSPCYTNRACQWIDCNCRRSLCCGMRRFMTDLRRNETHVHGYPLHRSLKKSLFSNLGQLSLQTSEKAECLDGGAKWKIKIQGFRCALPVCRSLEGGGTHLVINWKPLTHSHL